MLHHVSFNARDPKRVAKVLADMLDASPVRAPSPPFPREAWFVCFGDEAGSLIEVMPWGETREANAPRGVGRDELMRPSSGAHVLLSTCHAEDFLFALARRESWKAERADAGLFRFIKVWVENAFLVEFMTADMAADYVAAFGPLGVRTLEARLRALERKLADANSGG